MVRAIMIVEVAGHPPEHVKEHLTSHIGVLEKLDDVEVNSISISEPKEIADSEGIFTCFAEADFNVDKFSRLSEIMFDFMPSSVEVMEPNKVILEAVEATGLLNNLSGRLHRYDELARIAQVKISQLENELNVFRKMNESGKVNVSYGDDSKIEEKKVDESSEGKTDDSKKEVSGGGIKKTGGGKKEGKDGKKKEVVEEKKKMFLE
ncbi:MAG: hypothetical protein ABIF88_01235 [archaeon]